MLVHKLIIKVVERSIRTWMLPSQRFEETRAGVSWIKRNWIGLAGHQQRAVGVRVLINAAASLQAKKPGHASQNQTFLESVYRVLGLSRY